MAAQVTSSTIGSDEGIQQGIFNNTNNQHATSNKQHATNNRNNNSRSKQSLN